MLPAGLNIYQTYYLDARDRPRWSEAAVSKDKILCTRWMRAFAHTWTHFAFWVPWGRFIQVWDVWGLTQAPAPVAAAAGDLGALQANVP